MKKDIIKPEGDKLIEYLNNGYAICNECGAVMHSEITPAGLEVYVCPCCGREEDPSDYEYNYEGEDPEWTPEMLKILGEDDPILIGCLQCGGPYPYCKTACSLFDD